nr:TraR/DksA C4-type zinc finger protein [Flavobacteriales bacterium]
REGFFVFSYLRIMDEKQRIETKQSIENSILATQANIASLKELTKPISPENAIGRVSRMDAINNKSVNEAALRNAVNKLALLESALQRVNNENFGLCIRCNNPIPIQRILLMPQSNRCVHCASR